jgi:NAD-dependent deacetylase
VKSDIDISDVKIAAALLRNSERVVALTGAGVSTPSGIPDFRSRDTGLWDQVDPMTVASLLSFRHNPEKFFEWSRPLTGKIINAEPNPAHYGLAHLEEAEFLVAIVTQNIDNLHLKAGSKVVYEVHGHLREATCIKCFHHVDATEHILKFVNESTIPNCEQCGGILKPDVVLFGEQLPYKVANQAQEVVSQSDLILIVGSSLEVTPVALYPLHALDSGAKLIIINEEPTYLDSRADVVFHHDAAEVLPRLVDEVLNE